MQIPYEDFIWCRYPGHEETFHLCEENMDIGGGKLPMEAIDKLADYPDMDRIAVSGLRQDTFEYFITRYGKQFKIISFMKNKLVEDWSLLSELSGLEYLFWYHNQRISTLWDMSNNKALEGLFISDFSRLNSISGIEKAKNLRMFAIGNGIWPSMKIESLMPLAGLPIECLSWHGKEIIDHDLSFLTTLKQLRHFDCALNYFTMEQCAWIAANCPNAEGRIFAPYEDWNLKDKKLVSIIGKRKPTLNKQDDEQRIQRYVDMYEELKKQYRGMAYRDAFPE